jgi:hypothetical protein
MSSKVTMSRGEYRAREESETIVILRTIASIASFVNSCRPAKVTFPLVHASAVQNGALVNAWEKLENGPA